VNWLIVDLMSPQQDNKNKIVCLAFEEQPQQQRPNNNNVICGYAPNGAAIIVMVQGHGGMENAPSSSCQHQHQSRDWKCMAFSTIAPASRCHLEWDSLLPVLRQTTTNQGFAVMADCRALKRHDRRRPKTARVQGDERRPRRPKTPRTTKETKHMKKTWNEAQECKQQTKQQGVQASTNTKQQKQQGWKSMAFSPV